MQRCSRCILVDSVPGISFCENGVCNYCVQYENSFRNWDQIKEKKKKDFEKLIESARKLKRNYDCLVPLSGGKDSTYVLYLCSKEYNLRCLAVTFDNGYMSDRAKENINRGLEATHTDHFVFKMDRKSTAELFGTFIKKTGGFCNACMRSINFTIETAAKRFSIPLIIKGSGKRVQYVSQIPGITNSNSSYFFKRVISQSKIKDRFSEIGSEKIGVEFYKISYLLRISRTFLMRYFPQSIGVYDYIYKPYNEIMEIIQDEVGWKRPEDTHEHFDCLLHSIPFYRDTLKIGGITPRTFHNCGLIRQGLMSREEALRNDEEYFRSHNQKPDELEILLHDLKMKQDEFTQFIRFSDPGKFVPRFERLAKKFYRKVYYKK
ncbi:MAG: hypothetical protein JW786_12520 [Desulfobacterales bacterium]|nr:hypothetical protein [Desulfobacterales bacterium]